MTMPPVGTAKCWDIRSPPIGLLRDGQLRWLKEMDANYCSELHSVSACWLES